MIQILNKSTIYASLFLVTTIACGIGMHIVCSELLTSYMELDSELPALTGFFLDYNHLVIGVIAVIYSISAIVGLVQGPCRNTALHMTIIVALIQIVYFFLLAMAMVLPIVGIGSTVQP